MTFSRRPDPPQDMTELQYAAMLHRPDCSGCETDNMAKSITYYSLGVKLCNECAKTW